MSKILNPNLSIDEIKKNYLGTNVLKLSNDYSQNNSNNNFIPTFDFSTDIRLLMNSNATYFTQSNSNNPFGLSKLSMDKYNQIKSNNITDLNNKEQNINNINKINNIKENINNKKDEEKNKINLSDEDNEEIKNNIKKYKKINNNININKKKENENIKKSEEELEKENINNNLKVSSILNDTIGDNIYNKSKQNSNINENNDLIEFLKKENEDLKKSNEKNIQLINSLFFFINQLSFKYSPDKKVFDLSYYNSNISSFSSELNNLYEYINQQQQPEKNNNISITSNKTNLKKTEEKMNNNRSAIIKNKKDINNNKNKRRKNNDNINLGRTFTFGQNDSFNIKKSETKINKDKSGNKTNKTKFHRIKEDNQIKKNNNIRLNNSRSKSRSKNKNEIKLLGCNVKGNSSCIKNNSKISLENKNFSCIPNEKEAMQSIKNIIYKK